MDSSTSRHHMSTARLRMQVDASQLSELILQTRHAFNAHHNGGPEGPRFFRRDGQVVEFVREPEPHLRPVTSREMPGLVSECADFFREGRDGAASAMPPRELCADLLARPDPALPEIERIVEVPGYVTLCGRPTLLSAPGYNHDARVYLWPPVSLRGLAIPTGPSSDQVRWAVGMLHDILRDFPFLSQADLANAIAMLIQPFVRSLIFGPTPLYVIMSPSPQTGKTLLALLAALIARGRIPSLLSIQFGTGYAEAEVERKLFAALRGGAEWIYLDNLSTTLDSGTLAAILTTTHYRGRVIRTSETPAVNNFAQWIATANNLVVSPEFARRIVPIRLDARRENMDGRTFRYPNLHATVLGCRATIVSACLTIVQAWVAAGCPRQSVSFDSFGEYASILGGILASAGVVDFLANRAELRSRVHESDELGALVSAWHREFGGRAVHARDLLALLRRDQIPASYLGGGSAPAQAAAVGRYLGAKRDQIVGGLRIFAEADSHVGSKRYRLAPLDSGAGVAGESGEPNPQKI